MAQVFIRYRHVNPHKALANDLGQRLEAAGHRVFVDNKMLIGTAWVDEIDRQLRAAEVFIVLLSEASLKSDMVAKEVQIAHEERRKRPLKILPLRVRYQDALPYDLAAIRPPHRCC